MPSIKSIVNYPIHDLCSCENVTSTAIMESIDNFPDCLNSYDDDGCTALDYIVSNSSASIESIQFLASLVNKQVLEDMVARIDMEGYLSDRDDIVYSLEDLAQRIHRHHKTKHSTNIAASSMDVVTGSAGVTAAIAAPIGLVTAAPVVLPVAAGVALGFGVCSLVTRVSTMAVQHCDKKKINRKIRGTNETMRSLRIQDIVLNALFKRDHEEVQQMKIICDDLLRGIEVWDLPTVASLGFKFGKDYLTALDLMEALMKRGSLAALTGSAAASAGSVSAASVAAATSDSSSTAVRSVTSSTTTSTGTAMLASGATGALGAFSALWALYNIPIDIENLQNVPSIVEDLRRVAEHAKRENLALRKWGASRPPRLMRSAPFRLNQPARE